MSELSLRIGALSELYAADELKPVDLITQVYRRIADRGENHVWIYLVPESDALEQARNLSGPCLPSTEFPLP